MRRENDARFLDQAMGDNMESLDEGACEDKDTDVTRPAIGHVRQDQGRTPIMMEQPSVLRNPSSVAPVKKAFPRPPHTFLPGHMPKPSEQRLSSSWQQETCAAGDICSWSYFFKTPTQQNFLSPDSFPGQPRRTDMSPLSAGPLTSSLPSPPPFPCSSPNISSSPTVFALPTVLPKVSQKAVWM